MPTLIHSKLIPVRGLGLISSISIVIGSIIGTGIFLKSQVLVCNIGSPMLVMAVWMGAGLMALRRAYDPQGGHLRRAVGVHLVEFQRNRSHFIGE
jgi:basic amino acid/polyamine antiporter, APA family